MQTQKPLKIKLIYRHKLYKRFLGFLQSATFLKYKTYIDNIFTGLENLKLPPSLLAKK